MIKATGTVTDPAGTRPVLIMGLVPENTTRLLAGDPILFEAAELGLPPMRVVILGGATEEAIRAYLGPIMRPDTAEHAGPLGDHHVDWRSVAADLANELTRAFTAGVEWPAGVNGALRRWRDAVAREGL